MNSEFVVEHEITTSSGKTATAKSVMTLLGLREWMKSSIASEIALGSGRVLVDPSVIGLDIPVTTLKASWVTISNNLVDIENNQLVCVSELRAVSDRLTKPITITELGITSNLGLWSYAHIYDISGNSSAVTAEVGEFIRVNIRITVNTPKIGNMIPISTDEAHRSQGMTTSQVRVYAYYSDIDFSIGKEPSTAGTSYAIATGVKVTDSGVECFVPQNDLNSENEIKALYVVQGNKKFVFDTRNSSLKKSNEHQLSLSINLSLINV